MRFLFRKICFTVLAAAGIFIASPILAQAENSVSQAAQSDKKVELTQFSWEEKKFSFGIEGFSGVGFYDYTTPFNIVQLNFRMLPVSNLQLSLHGSVNYNFKFSLFVPVLFNIGYGQYYFNRYFFIEGGGGIELGHVNTNMIINISSGLEWLIAKSYAVGFKGKLGYIFNEESFNIRNLFLDLSITANLVF